MNTSMEIWSGFHNKSLEEKLKILAHCLPNLDLSSLYSQDNNSFNKADLMIENCIGSIPIPLGICPYFVINGQRYVVPMAVEEPSVIAACSSASKLISLNGGFSGGSTENIMSGQICLYDLKNTEKTLEFLMKQKDFLINKANGFCRSMVKRGGGVVNFHAQVIKGIKDKEYILVTIDVDVKDCMGANTVNTICEGISPWLSKETKGRIGLRILTNLCTKRMSTVSFLIPVKKLAWHDVEGEVVANRILEAYDFARENVYRTATNNKGTMNGCDAVAVATGQDWRAIESAAHAYAAIKNNGRANQNRINPLADYSIVSGEHNEEKVLKAELTLPISVGVVGGATRSTKMYRFSLDLLGNPSAKELSQIILAAGLANNFAALRALAVEGIQKGHMALHERKKSKNKSY